MHYTAREMCAADDFAANEPALGGETEDESASSRRRRKRRGPAKATAESLERAALAYLDRLDSTAANLRRVLMRRVHKSARAHGTDPEEGARIIDRLIERYLQSGLLDDERYAATMAYSLRQKGSSVRAIRHKLAGRGVSRDSIDAVFEAEGIDDGEGELAAARAFARRRRLGPYRTDDDRPARRARDLGALARAGFSFEVARQVIDVDESEIEDP